MNNPLAIVLHTSGSVFSGIAGRNVSTHAEIPKRAGTSMPVAFSIAVLIAGIFILALRALIQRPPDLTLVFTSMFLPSTIMSPPPASRPLHLISGLNTARATSPGPTPCETKLVDSCANKSAGKPSPTISSKVWADPSNNSEVSTIPFGYLSRNSFFSSSGASL